MKIPAEFAPKSWEMPPGARVIEATASVVARDFDGETLNWLVALVEIPNREEPIVWARPLDLRFDAGFIIRHGIEELYGEGDAPENQLSLHKIWRQNFFDRQFIFNSKGELRTKNGGDYKAILVSSFAGLATWTPLDYSDEFSVTSTFRWRKQSHDAELLRVPALELWKQLQPLLFAPDSEASFARRFNEMDDEERGTIIFNSAPPSHEEAEKLLCSLLIFHDVWSEVPEDAKLSFHCSSEEARFLNWISDFDDDDIKLTSSLNDDISYLWDSLFVSKEIKSYYCVVKWLEGYSPSFDVNVYRPTAHEQLEAKLRWREWKAKHEKI